MSTILQIAFQSLLLRWPSCLAIACVLMSASGCAMVSGVTKVVASSTANLFSGPPGPSFLDWKAMTVVAAPDVNQNSPLALDLVFVRDTAALEKLLTMSASKWFSSKDELMKTYPNAMTIKSWELVPQQVLQLSEEALGSPRVAGMVLFADYLTPGDHRAQLALDKVSFLVDLSSRSFSVKTKSR
jgi:type VI secretion system protein